MEGATSDIEVGVDQVCREGVTVADDSRDDDSGAVDPDSGEDLAASTGEEERPPTGAVTVVITAGDEVEGDAGEVELEVHQPNGR